MECGESGISETMLDKAFGVWYPTLEEELNGLKEGNENDLEKNIQEENYSAEIIEEILELSRDNQKLLRNPNPKLNDSIDELKERLELTLSKVERNIDFEERRMPRKYKSIFMEELIHSILPDCQKQYVCIGCGYL